VAFSADGKTLAAVGRSLDGDSKVRFWELATGKELSHTTEQMNLPLKREQARDLITDIQPRLAFSPDGRMAALNRPQKTISIWEITSGSERLQLTGHEDSPLCVIFSPDGRTLASASWDDTIRLWDAGSGAELLRLKGHRGSARCLAFSPDGKLLASGGHDTTILLWDVAQVTRRSLLSSPLTSGEFEALWTTLASDDAAKAYQAIGRLAADPSGTISALKTRLPPATVSDPRRVTSLLGHLDSNDYQMREKASQELQKMGDTIQSPLTQALARAPTSPELRRRVEHLLQHLERPRGQALQELRALEVLERAATAEAKNVLTTIAGGSPESRLTQQAKASLVRLARPRAAAP
jgi:hypothetical protein